VGEIIDLGGATGGSIGVVEGVTGVFGDVMKWRDGDPIIVSMLEECRVCDAVTSTAEAIDQTAFQSHELSSTVGVKEIRISSPTHIIRIDIVMRVPS
jgi:hypothetical protein